MSSQNHMQINFKGNIYQLTFNLHLLSTVRTFKATFLVKFCEIFRILQKCAKFRNVNFKKMETSFNIVVFLVI